MKPFRSLKFSLIFLAFAAPLLFSPACKAQSEVSPDHFDGTDPWETAQPAPRKPAAPKAKPVPSKLQAQNHKSDASATLQLAAKRDSSIPAQPGALAIADKRKQSSAPAPKKP